MTPPVATSPAILPYDPARHGDGPWRVVKAVFDEYGFPFDEFDYDADLRDPASRYDGTNGWFAVAEEGSRVVGCVALKDEGDGIFELHRLYVALEARRGGTGERLIRWALDEARARGARSVILFSDVAFTDAHRLYERLGFRQVRFRYAPDPWQSPEWGYEMTLDPGAN
jgi:GNAT superfamily N-acetyltransferase